MFKLHRTPSSNWTAQEALAMAAAVAELRGDAASAAKFRADLAAAKAKPTHARASIAAAIAVILLVVIVLLVGISNAHAGTTDQGGRVMVGIATDRPAGGDYANNYTPVRVEPETDPALIVVFILLIGGVLGFMALTAIADSSMRGGR